MRILLPEKGIEWLMVVGLIALAAAVTAVSLMASS